MTDSKVTVGDACLMVVLSAFTKERFLIDIDKIRDYGFILDFKVLSKVSEIKTTISKGTLKHGWDKPHNLYYNITQYNIGEGSG